jgi:tryptophan synthase alpha chain
MSAERIFHAFRRLRDRGEKGLIPFVTAGYPDLETTERLVLGMAEAGADLVELGVPFSDPLADGPVIQRASQAALAGGVNLAGILELVAGVRGKTDIPLVLMSYYNPVLSFGPEALVSAAVRAGVDGLIIPDLPVEEAGGLRNLGDARGLALIPLVAPTSTPRRIATIARQARGFVYCVSLAGVTGSQRGYSEKLAGVIRTVRAHTDLPVAVGFGIAEPEQVRKLAPHADALIVGSAIVDRISRAGENEAVSVVKEVVLGLKRALVKI